MGKIFRQNSLDASSQRLMRSRSCHAESFRNIFVSGSIGVIQKMILKQCVAALRFCDCMSKGIYNCLPTIVLASRTPKEKLYNKAPCQRQYCYSHLSRNVKDLGKEFPEKKEVQNFVDATVPLLARAMQLRALPIAADPTQDPYRLLFGPPDTS